MNTNDFREMLREVRDYERRMGFGETVLTEGKDTDNVQIVNGTIVFNRTAAQEQELQEALTELNEQHHEPEPKPKIVTESRLPETSVKVKDDKREIPDDIHARLACAIDGTHLLGARPLAQERMIDETKKNATIVELPEGIHQKLYEALGGNPLAPEGFHERLARAVCR